MTSSNFHWIPDLVRLSGLVRNDDFYDFYGLNYFYGFNDFYDFYDFYGLNDFYESTTLGI